MFSKSFGVLTLAVGMTVGGIMAMPSTADARSSSGGGFSSGSRSSGGSSYRPSYSAPAQPAYRAPAQAAPVRTYNTAPAAAPAVQSRPTAVAPAAQPGGFGSGKRLAPAAAGVGVGVGAGLAAGSAAHAQNSQSQTSTTQAGSSAQTNGVKPASQQNLGSARAASSVQGQKPLNKTDAALAQKATMTGFKSKSRAEQSKILSNKFGSKDKYNFKSEPKTRPSHIPSSASVGGRNYTVVYNNGHYGYYGPGNVWATYDPFTNALLAAALVDAMTDRPYYPVAVSPLAQPYGGGYVQQPMSAPAPVMPVPHRSNPWPVIITIIALCVLAIVFRSRVGL